MKYTIFKNWHYSLPPFISIYWNEDVISKNVTISKEAWFEKENNDDFDINKLFGICYGLRVHKNSIRIGWVPEKEGYIKLYYYAYENETVHTQHYLTTIKTEEETRITLVGLQSENLNILINEKIVYSEENECKKTKLVFGLKPYHGGNNRSKKTYTIKIKSNK